MTTEDVKFIEDLKDIDYSLAMWAEVKLDDGVPLTDLKDALVKAVTIAEPLRQKAQPIGDLIDADIDRAIAEGKHVTEL